MVWMSSPLPIHMLNPIPQGNSLKRWGLWEVVKPWGSILMRGISALIEGAWERSHTLSSREDTARRCCLWTRKWALTRPLIYMHLDLGLTSLQKCEKCIFVIYEPPSFWYFVLVPWMDHDKNKFSYPLFVPPSNGRHIFIFHSSSQLENIWQNQILS